jgi:hypothetical protein
MRARWVLLSVLLVWACESPSPWEGRYEGAGTSPPSPGVALALLPGGKGEWSVEQETTPLRWEERSGSVRLHLKTGGVLAARPIPGEPALLVELPGVGMVKLHKR